MESLELKSKISLLQLLWCGRHFKNMIITVDLVGAFPILRSLHKDLYTANSENQDLYYAIAKINRNELVTSSELNFQLCNKCEDARELASLHKYMQHGYILAKAVRIAQIAQPSNIEDISLCGTINTDDLITSFLLKRCLFHLKQRLPSLSTNAYDLVEHIYEAVEVCLQVGRAGLRTVHGDVEYFFKCPHNKGQELAAACCLKRRAALTVCRTIRAWLRENKSKLEHVTYGTHLVYSRQRKLLQKHMVCIVLFISYRFLDQSRRVPKIPHFD